MSDVGYVNYTGGNKKVKHDAVVESPAEVQRRSGCSQKSGVGVDAWPVCGPV